MGVRHAEMESPSATVFAHVFSLVFAQVFALVFALVLTLVFTLVFVRVFAPAHAYVLAPELIHLLGAPLLAPELRETDALGLSSTMRSGAVPLLTLILSILYEPQ